MPNLPNPAEPLRLDILLAPADRVLLLHVLDNEADRWRCLAEITTDIDEYRWLQLDAAAAAELRTRIADALYGAVVAP